MGRVLMRRTEQMSVEAAVARAQGKRNTSGGGGADVTCGTPAASES